MRTRLSVAIAIVFTSLLAELAAAQTQGAAPGVETLSTQDGVQLKITYFPSAARRGTAQAKQATPVILLHDYKETRAIFNSLAQRLQSPAGDNDAVTFAAVTVDLRGHGESTRQVFPNAQTAALDASKLRQEDFLAMITMDLAAVRSFLVGKNDAGELNLNKLCLVGSGMGASVAANWALQDWNWPPLAIGKQGQDVKAAVLISPQWSFHGLSFQFPMRDRQLKQNLAWMLVYGSQSDKIGRDVRRIEKQLERFHTEPKTTTGRRASSRTLQVIELQSNLQGSTLLRQAGGPVEEQIVAFLREHVGEKQQPWINRRNRLP